jgi:hypothetical protein
MLCFIATEQKVQAQAPYLLWTTNIGARLFAVDAQTNLLANTNGTVITLSSAGVPISTNLVCPTLNSTVVIAQRDSSGNLWFFGNFDGTNNFGGTILVGGWTNWPSPGHWTPGYPTCFLAKYTANGQLQFVTGFGQQADACKPYDIALDGNGGAYCSYYPITDFGRTRVSHFDASGSLEWEYQSFKDAIAFSLGGVTPSNCNYLVYEGSSPTVTAGKLSLTGSNSVYLTSVVVRFSSLYSTNNKPVIDDLAREFQAGNCCMACGGCAGPVILRKLNSGGSVWDVSIGSEEQFTLARDIAGNLYLGGATGTFSEYSTDGILIWSTNYGFVPASMIVDGSGTRFLNFVNGVIARVSDSAPPQPPVIDTGPASQTVFIGDPVAFTVAATGTQPLTYSWRLNATNVLSSTSNNYSIAAAALANAGSYIVAVGNAAATVTSAPALLRVKQVELYNGSQLLTNGNYVFPVPPTFTIRSAFSGGSIFYTLNGSAPDFSSSPYSGPITISNSAVVRAIGYSADFTQSDQADTANVTVLPYHTLTASSTGGGSVALNPPGGTYASTNVVQATAMPLPGWSFLGWQGDASGPTPVISVSMDRDKTIYAVFGTMLGTTAVGNGQIQVYPASGPYAYGAVVRLTAVPQTGSYFGAWGNAASGNTNPLYFAISAPTQIVSSIFGTLNSTQAALTILVNGSGRASPSPRANVYGTNQSVTITATPDPGQMFVNWSGDASGAQNPLSVAMTQSRVITANFGQPGLFVIPGSGDGPSPTGFKFSIVSSNPSILQVSSSSNLANWNPIATVTNTQGRFQFTDPTATNRARLFYKATAP